MAAFIRIPDLLHGDGDFHTQGRFSIGQGALPPSPDSLVAARIQKLADRSDVISEVPKCPKIQSAPDPAESLQRSPRPRN